MGTTISVITLALAATAALAAPARPPASAPSPARTPSNIQGMMNGQGMNGMQRGMMGGGQSINGMQGGMMSGMMNPQMMTRMRQMVAGMAQRMGPAAITVASDGTVYVLRGRILYRYSHNLKLLSRAQLPGAPAAMGMPRTPAPSAPLANRGGRP